jgi:hypothetical protein
LSCSAKRNISVFALWCCQNNSPEILREACPERSRRAQNDSAPNFIREIRVIRG